MVQIQQTAVQSQRALNVTLQQTSVKDRERRILQLTIDEISQLQGDINLYKGVGKMCVPLLVVVDRAQTFVRFMHVPRATMEEELKAQEKELAEDIASLNKKARAILITLMLIQGLELVRQAKYLEKQYNDAQGQLRDIVCIPAESMTFANWPTYSSIMPRNNSESYPTFGALSDGSPSLWSFS